jgi:purine nucleoside phosphorylase
VALCGETPTNRRALVFLSRTHLYEGKGVRPVVHGVRTAAAAGCSTVVLTNGSGGLRPEWGSGYAGVDQRPHQPLGEAAPLDHEEVLAAGRAAADRCGALLAGIVQRIVA